jgi:hypothetical protein
VPNISPLGSKRVQYKCNAGAMQVQCKCNASPMQVQCRCSLAGAMQVTQYRLCAAVRRQVRRSAKMASS